MVESGIARRPFHRQGAALVIFCLGMLAAGGGMAASDAIVLTNVNVLPMDTHRVVENQSILVRDGRIAALGGAGELAVPAGARVVDGGGGYVMPGLSDMHAHLAGPVRIPDAETRNDVAANQLLSYLATGVTLIRDTSGSPVHFDYRQRLQSGAFLGPDLFFTSPVLEGENAVWDFSVQVTDPDSAEALVAGYAARGYWGIKVYHTVTAEVFDAIMTSAARNSIRVIGHVPFEVGIDTALRRGMYSIEHLRGYDFDGLSLKALAAEGGRSAQRFRSIEAMSDERMRELVDLTVLTGTWNTPTLAINRFLFDSAGRAALAQEPRFNLVHPHLRNAVVAASNLDDIFSKEAREALQDVLPRQKELVERLHARGGGILIGTDAVVPAYVPGFTPIDEMAAIADAGIPLFEVLQAATLDAAVSLGVEARRGTVAVGKEASLILLARNPLDDVEHLWELRGVLHGGQWLAFADLEERLRLQADSFAGAR